MERKKIEAMSMSTMIYSFHSNTREILYDASIASIEEQSLSQDFRCPLLGEHQVSCIATGCRKTSHRLIEMRTRKRRNSTRRTSHSVWSRLEGLSQGSSNFTLQYVASARSSIAFNPLSGSIPERIFNLERWSTKPRYPEMRVLKYRSQKHSTLSHDLGIFVSQRNFPK